MNKQEQNLLDTVEKLSDDILDLTCRLVEQPSTLGNEKGAVEVMDATLQRLGYTTRRVDLESEQVSQHQGFAPVSWSLAGKQNVVASLSPGGVAANPQYSMAMSMW